MIITKLIGGLGNQFFQYAAGRALAEMHQTELLLDTTSFNDYPLYDYSLCHYNINAETTNEDDIAKFNNKANSAEQDSILKLFNRPDYLIYKEPRKQMYGFNKKFLKCPANTYLQGHWVNQNYFSAIRYILLKELTLSQSVDDDNLKFKEIIKSVNSISLHVRRGDYVSNPRTNKYHGLCSLNYYVKAMDLIKTKFNDPVFFVFSDDHNWIKENLKINSEYYFVDINDNSTPYLDLELMKRCKHHIIANSTFSWWGAWLCENPDKIVIAPKKWTQTKKVNSNQIILNKWIKI